MGLDMYLTKKVYVKNWDHLSDTERWDITLAKGGSPVKSELPFTHIEFEAAYWRKANQVHNWFVENVQGRRDDQGDYYASREELEQLLSLCKQVLDVAEIGSGPVHQYTSWSSAGTIHVAKEGRVITNPEAVEELLPTQAGFFFGGTDYDDWYLKQIESTIQQLEIALADPLDGDFYYHTGW